VSRLRAVPLLGALLLGLVLGGCGAAPPAPVPAAGRVEVPPPVGAPTPEPATAPADVPVASAPVVVLDPGHNGGNAAAAREIAREVPDGRGGTKPCNTTGTETADGYAEHAFAFDVAARVTALLTARGVDVRSTRTDDDGVGPCVDRRAAIANDAGAALTVSIHADSAPASGRGFHVATSSPALSASQGAPSQALARDLVSALTAEGFVPSTYRGEGGLDPRDDLAGLNEARVPAALVECANMANPAEADVVADADGRQRYADALAAGILRTLGR
jgi:N-acetylmuramoyl-L-alanine amidase